MSGMEIMDNKTLMEALFKRQSIFLILGCYLLSNVLQSNYSVNLKLNAFRFQMTEQKSTVCYLPR